MPFPILLISGPPGSGKSTVARRLADSALAARALHLPGDAFWGFIRRGFVPPHDSRSKTQNEIVMAAVADVAARFAQGEYEVIVDFVVAPWHLDVFRTAAQRVGARLAYVILLPGEEECARRAASRRDDPITDYAPLRPLHASFAEAEAYRAHILSAVDGSNAIADAIRTGLADGKFLLD